MTGRSDQLGAAPRVAHPGCHWRLVRQCSGGTGCKQPVAPGASKSRYLSGNAGGRRRAAGTILIVTLWILVVLAGLVLVLAQAMRVEGVCSANSLASQRAAAVEQGAIQYVIASLDGCTGQAPTEADLICQGVQVGNGAFWIVRPDPDDDRQLAYGLADEGGKINLNSATDEMLSKLPDMTADVAPAIVDWRDPDSTLTVGGAESEYYLLLAEPYECKNAPLETVEELLLVRLATRELLFGEDVNRNGVLDTNEDDADASDPPDNRDGHLDAGIAGLVTVYSREPNTAADGSPRVNVNQGQGQELVQVLNRSVARNRVFQVMDTLRRARPFQSVIDFYFRAGLTPDEFKGIADYITTQGGQTVAGLLNVNTASKKALLCLPTLEESDVSALVAGRPAEATEATDTTEAAEPADIAWVANALAEKKAIAIGPYITARSFQYSADIVSISADGRAFKRCRIVVDAAQSPPRILYRQDLTYLGWPLSPDVVTLLRSGAPLEEVLDTTYQETQ